ncbi:MAG: glutathionylspermidine synthase family protein [Chloroflexota bacterium]
MRALREHEGPADADTLWETFLLEAIRTGPLPDFCVYGEPCLALNGVVLDRQEHKRMVGLTARFAAVFQKAVQVLAQDAVALERLGFPWMAAELLAREPPDVPFLVGRFDFVLDTGGGWQLLEYNADTPSGPRETIAVEPLIARWLQGSLPAPLARTGPRLAGALRRAFARATGEQAPGGVLGIVTDAGYAEDLAQTTFLARLLAPALARRGVEVVAGDVDNLDFARGRLRILGRPLDALYRYYPFETLLGRQAFADLFAAVSAGQLRLLNGLRGLLAQNKGLLAWLWEHRDDAVTFSPAERRAIREHLPPVRWIDTVSPSEDRRALVLKQVFGREGEEVYFGDRLADADWERCRAWGSYVVQQRVAMHPVRLAVRTAGGPAVRDLWPVVGSFAVHNTWAGYYTRLGDPITTDTAKFVATFVE